MYYISPKKERIIRQYMAYLDGSEESIIPTISRVSKVRHERPKDELERQRELDERRSAQEESAHIKEDIVCTIIRFAIENLLKWHNPKTAMYAIDKKTAERLGFDRLLSYVSLPSGLSSDKEYAYLIHLAYPKQTHFDMGQELITLYKAVLDGRITKFPKKIFNSKDALKNLDMMLSYYLSMNFNLNSVEEKYALFSDNAKANKILKKAKLYYSCRDFYSSPLDFLDHSLGRERDPFLYSYYSYMSVYNNIDNNINKDIDNNTNNNSNKKDKKSA